jgi:hypothetical protein
VTSAPRNDIVLLRGHWPGETRLPIVAVLTWSIHARLAEWTASRPQLLVPLPVPNFPSWWLVLGSLPCLWRTFLTMNIVKTVLWKYRIWNGSEKVFKYFNTVLHVSFAYAGQNCPWFKNLIKECSGVEISIEIIKDSINLHNEIVVLQSRPEDRSDFTRKSRSLMLEEGWFSTMTFQNMSPAVSDHLLLQNSLSAPDHFLLSSLGHF